MSRGRRQDSIYSVSYLKAFRASAWSWGYGCFVLHKSGFQEPLPIEWLQYTRICGSCRPPKYLADQKSSPSMIRERQISGVVCDMFCRHALAVGLLAHPESESNGSCRRATQDSDARRPDKPTRPPDGWRVPSLHFSFSATEALLHARTPPLAPTKRLD